MSNKKSNNPKYARYKAENRLGKNKLKKLRKTLKKQPNNSQVKSLIEAKTNGLR